MTLDQDPSPMPSSGSERRVFEVGTTVGGYRVKRFIASGGMGEVYEAESLSLDTLASPIALKTIRIDRLDDEKIHRRFERECRVIEMLDHPSIAKVFSSGVDQGTPFIAMELLDGETLAQKLDREGTLDVDALAVVLDPICNALSHAHARGIIHRDIKPSNVFVAKGRVILTDFGVAAASFASVDISSTGVAVGTPAYLSPEQILDEPVKPASDVYALGILMFECLTGRYPFAGESPISQAVARLTQPAPRVSAHVKSVPVRVDDLVASCLARDPASRPASTLDVVRILRSARSEPRPHWMRALAGALLFFLASGGYILTGRLHEGHGAGVLPRHVADGPFRSISPMKVERDGHTGTLLPDGTVLVAGGTNGEVLDTAEIYDPSDASFQFTGRLTTPRRAHTATRLRDGRILVMGGDGEAGALRTTEIYDPVKRQFSRVAPMTQPRDAHTSSLLADGTVLITGGGYASVRATASTEIYDPQQGSFSAASPMLSARLFHAAARLRDGRVLIVAGWGGESTTTFSLIRTAEIYDPARRTFSYTGELNESRYAPSATLLRDGRVLVVGGYGPRNISRASAEVYDPSTGRFSLVGLLSAGRTFHSATLLPDGKVLVAGGFQGPKHVEAELFDPVTNRFRSAGKLNMERYGHVAALLRDGSVLLAGGSGAGYQKSAEVFREQH